jgi:hypothetical protein
MRTGTIRLSAAAAVALRAGVLTAVLAAVAVVLPTTAAASSLTWAGTTNQCLDIEKKQCGHVSVKASSDLTLIKRFRITWRNDCPRYDQDLRETLTVRNVSARVRRSSEGRIISFSYFHRSKTRFKNGYKTWLRVRFRGHVRLGGEGSGVFNATRRIDPPGEKPQTCTPTGHHAIRWHVDRT